MINFLKNLLPKTLSIIAWVFDLISKAFILSSFFFHKLFKTPLGIKLIKFETDMKKIEAVAKQMEAMTQVKNTNNTKRRTIVPMDADPKLVKILNKGSNDDGNKN